MDVVGLCVVGVVGAAMVHEGFVLPVVVVSVVAVLPMVGVRMSIEAAHTVVVTIFVAMDVALPISVFAQGNNRLSSNILSVLHRLPCQRPFGPALSLPRPVEGRNLPR